jgi:hypothetical protein
MAIESFVERVKDSLLDNGKVHSDLMRTQPLLLPLVSKSENRFSTKNWVMEI